MTSPNSTAQCALKARWFLPIAVAAALLAGTSFSLQAAPVKVVCEGESFVAPELNTGTMTVTYEGGDSGMLAVKGPHTNFSLKASSIVKKSKIRDMDLTTTRISGSGDTTATVPVRAAVEACIAKEVPPDLAMDADTTAITAQRCLGKLPANATPVPVKAAAVLTLIADSDPKNPLGSVEVTLTYLEKSPTGKDAIKFELLPKDCKVLP